MALPYQVVLFDWDGTIVDTAEHVWEANAEAFAAHGLPLDRAAFTAAYTPDWQTMFRAIGVPEERFAALIRDYILRFRARPARLFPDVRAALLELRARGVRLGVVTAGPRGVVAPQMAGLGLASAFSVLVADGEAPRGKPHPDPLLRALALLGAPPSPQVAYLGDAVADVAAANAAGVHSVGVTGSFLSPEEFAARAGACEIAGSTAGWIRRLVEAHP
jgi:HAD superfamily hydrolase (TIGR01509 family)